MTSRTPGGHSIHLATRTYEEDGHFTEFVCNRRPAYCCDDSADHGFDSCRFPRPTLVPG